LSCIKRIKKEKEGLFFASLAYGRFLLSTNRIAAPMMIMTMIMAATPYMRVVFEAKPVSGVAVGAVVGPVVLA